MADFKEKWIQAGGPTDAAIFGVKVAKGMDVYITPAAAKLVPELLQEYDAVPCARPNLTNSSGIRKLRC